MNNECTCNGIGWLREDKGVNEDGFGKLVPCVCNKEALEKLQPALPEPEPELHPFLLKWQEYTD